MRNFFKKFKGQNIFFRISAAIMILMIVVSSFGVSVFAEEDTETEAAEETYTVSGAYLFDESLVDMFLFGTLTFESYGGTYYGIGASYSSGSLRIYYYTEVPDEVGYAAYIDVYENGNWVNDLYRCILVDEPVENPLAYQALDLYAERCVPISGTWRFNDTVNFEYNGLIPCPFSVQGSPALVDLQYRLTEDPFLFYGFVFEDDLIVYLNASSDPPLESFLIYSPDYQFSSFYQFLVNNLASAGFSSDCASTDLIGYGQQISFVDGYSYLPHSFYDEFVLNAERVVVTPTTSVLSVFTGVTDSIVSLLDDALVVFYVEGSGLTFVGYVALIGVGLSLAFLIIGLISNFLKNRG